MQPYPLKQLSIYRVKKDFTSDRGFENLDRFKKDQLIQFQESISNIHDMIEIIHFRDAETNKVMIWKTRVENLYDNWGEYLMPAKD